MKNQAYIHTYIYLAYLGDFICEICQIQLPCFLTIMRLEGENKNCHMGTKGNSTLHLL